jgi:hypothetical protein
MVSLSTAFSRTSFLKSEVDPVNEFIWTIEFKAEYLVLDGSDQ